jgi:CBS domain containing-hemolysin-like protein
MTPIEHVSIDAFGVAWRLGATLFFVVLNGFFVAAEFALVKVRSSRINELAAAGGRRARGVQHILSHLDLYLSACQLGITLASLILGALGEPAVSVLIVALVGTLGVAVAADAAWLPFVSIGIAFAVITMLHMTVGEQAPKMWALRRAEGTALRVGLTLRIFAFVFRPFIAAVNGISNWMLRLVGVSGVGHHDVPTAEEIRSILSVAATSGHISDREYELTENVFRMISLEVRHLIVPRVDVDYLSLERSPEENLRKIRKTRHSRLPLCEVGLDTVIGIVHAKDALDHALERERAGTPPDLQSIAREALFVPDTMSLSNFLMELQAKLSHCAVVLDERGTAIGMAFREDALEEIVGPLGDEFDALDSELIHVEAGVYELSGRLSVPEVCDRLEFELEPEEDESEDTIGGHLTARLGRLPQKGDCVAIGPYDAEVLDVTRRRVQRLRMTRRPEDREEGAAAEPESRAVEPAGSGEDGE